jgi:hypothetical protein
MTRFLYNHLPVFRKSVNKILFSQQKKSPDLEFMFVDSNGKRYFRYKSDMMMPMVRKGVIDHFMTKLTTSLTDKELNEYLTIITTNLDEMMNAGKLKSKPFSLIRVSVEQMQERQKVMLHPELCWDLCAIVYIREDEIEGDTYNDEIHNEKVSQFKKDSRTGLHDFFFMSGWQAYLPYSSISPNELKSYVTSIAPRLVAEEKWRLKWMPASAS